MSGKRANNYDVPSTMPPGAPTRRVDFVDIEALAEMCDGKGCVLCRCYKSKSFPFCDGAHASHRKETGDNAGPVVVKRLPEAEKRRTFCAETSEEELRKPAMPPGRANNYGIVSTLPPESPSKCVHTVDYDVIRDLVEKEGRVQLCRCFKSKTFPLCDGSHKSHNEQTGDNAGPVVIKRLAQAAGNGGQ